MRLGAIPCFFKSRVSARFAALVIATALDNLVENIAILINGPPQPVLLAGDVDDHFIQMPEIVGAWLLATKAPGIVRTELLSCRVWGHHFS
jgi:hypothetical protein